MPKIGIYIDEEWYPMAGFDAKYREGNGHTEITVTEEQKTYLEKTFAEFNKAQKFIEQLWKNKVVWDEKLEKFREKNISDD